MKQVGGIEAVLRKHLKQVRGIRAVLEKHMKQVGGIRAVYCFSKAGLLGMSL
jgi:hypothetical protein